MEERKIKMKNKFSGYIIPFTSVLFIAWMFSCSGRPEGTHAPVSGKREVNMEAPGELIRIKMPAENSQFRTGDNIKVVIESAGGNTGVDSVVISYDGAVAGVLKSGQWEFTIPARLTGNTGKKALKVTAFSNRRSQSAVRFLIILSDKKPVRYGFKTVHTYPHDSEAFTQGLFFHEGRLYEGTGQEAGSSLREVELETGRVIRQINLDPSLFGEGITLYKDRIYQVTWQNKVGFVYERATFNLISKIYYQTQGWGLTTVGDRIAMSDGSNIIYFYEPELFTVESRIEVYDNEKAVDQLNELEYINGEIWANIWMTDLIARIDPITGKVNSYIDLSMIFPDSKRTEVNADVLNGIAYDASGNRIFVTGKRWPKLYEIRVVE